MPLLIEPPRPLALQAQPEAVPGGPSQRAQARCAPRPSTAQGGGRPTARQSRCRASGLALLTVLATVGCAQGPGVPVEPEPLPVPATVASPAPSPVAAPAAPAASAPATPGPAEAAAARLQAWHERLRELPAAELSREAARRDPPADAAAAVEAALALLHARSLAHAAGAPANGELARAAALLEPVLRSPSPWQVPAKLLAARVAEQRRLEEQIAQLQQQLREQQRRNEQLAAQIDALRAIERSLGGARPAPPSPR